MTSTLVMHLSENGLMC